MTTEKQWLVLYKVYHNEIEAFKIIRIMVDLGRSSSMPDRGEIILALVGAWEIAAQVEVNEMVEVVRVEHIKI